MFADAQWGAAGEFCTGLACGPLRVGDVEE